MSGPENVPDPDADELEAGGLDEVLPEPLVPAYRQFERVQNFRETYGPKYTTALEAVLAVLLIVGYGFWLYLFFVAG